jgi:hypothetical protein
LVILPNVFLESSPPRPFLNILVKQKVAKLKIIPQERIMNIQPLSFNVLLLLIKNHLAKYARWRPDHPNPPERYDSGPLC